MSDAASGRGATRVGRRVLAAVAIVGALLWSGVRPAETEAAWTEAEYGSAQFTTLTVAPVTMSACTVSPGILGAFASFVITFQLPAGYAIADARYAVASNAAMTDATTFAPSVSGPNGANYTASFNTGLLGLLGTNAYLGIRIAHSSGWLSMYRVAQGNMPPLGGTMTCTVL